MKLDPKHYRFKLRESQMNNSYLPEDCINLIMDFVYADPIRESHLDNIHRDIKAYNPIWRNGLCWEYELRITLLDDI